MTLKEARILAKEYKKSIEYHNKKYYEEDSPEIDDYEYDAMVRNLEELESEFPELITEESPTQHIGGKASKKFSPVLHEVKMESLHDSFSFDDMIAFYERVKKSVVDPVFVVEPNIIADLPIFSASTLKIYPSSSEKTLYSYPSKLAR